MPFQISLLRSPSVISTANCRISGIFLGFSPSNGRWEPNVGVSKTRAERALLQIVVQSRQSFPNPITEELAVIRNSMWQKCLCHPSVIGTFRERSEAHRNCSSNESM